MAGNAIAEGMAPWLPAVTSGLSLLTGATRALPAGPSSADPFTSITNDFGQWTVSTGNSKATASNAQGAAIPDWLKFAALGLAAVVAVRWIARKN